jgi:hypothetical protein
MNLSQRHQELFNEYFPDFEVKQREKGDFHVMFVDIIPDGKRTRDVPVMQKFNPKEWVSIKKSIEKLGIGITGHDEYSIIHDPTVKQVKPEPKGEAKEVKPEPKPKGRPPAQKPKPE